MKLTLVTVFITIFASVIARTEDNLQTSKREGNLFLRKEDMSTEINDELADNSFQTDEGNKRDKRAAIPPKEIIFVTVQLNFTNDTYENVIPPLNLTASQGTTAFQLLQLAAKVNPCYVFQYRSFNIGRYITTICCIAENKTTNFYWFVYINGTLSPVGVDLLKPRNGDILTFKYRFINSTSTDHTEAAVVNSSKTAVVPINSVTVQLIFTDYTNPDVIPPLELTAPQGTTAFQLLQQAAKMNPCYISQYISYSFGRYITTICCVAENKTSNFYWMIYINGTLSPVGVDLLKPKDGDILTFKYQFVDFSSTNHTATVAVTGGTNNTVAVTGGTNNTVAVTGGTNNETTGEGQQIIALNLNAYVSLAIGVLALNLYGIA